MCLGGENVLREKKTGGKKYHPEQEVEHITERGEKRIKGVWDEKTNSKGRRPGQETNKGKRKRPEQEKTNQKKKENAGDKKPTKGGEIGGGCRKEIEYHHQPKKKKWEERKTVGNTPEKKGGNK